MCLPPSHRRPLVFNEMLEPRGGGHGVILDNGCTEPSRVTHKIAEAALVDARLYHEIRENRAQADVARELTKPVIVGELIRD